MGHTFWHSYHEYTHCGRYTDCRRVPGDKQHLANHEQLITSPDNEQTYPEKWRLLHAVNNRIITIHIKATRVNISIIKPCSTTSAVLQRHRNEYGN